MSTEEDKKLASLLMAFTLAYQRLENAVVNDRDLDRSFRRATQTSEHMRDLSAKLADLRATLALQIYERERLSLQELADRWSMSKARSAQLVNEGKAIAARKTEEEQ